MIENMDLAKVIKKLHAQDLALHISTAHWGMNGDVGIWFIFVTKDGRHRWSYLIPLSDLYSRSDNRLDKLVDEAIKQVGRKAKVEEDD